MKREEDNLMSPALGDLLERIPQKYELVLTATKRAKQIIRDQRMMPQNYSAADLAVKPLTTALHEIVQGRIDKDSLLMAPDVEMEDGFDEEPDIMADIERGRAAFTTPSEAGFPDFGEEDGFDDDEDIEVEDDLEDEVESEE